MHSESIPAKQASFDEQSPGLLPRVSISNIKSPSKRHQVSIGGRVSASHDSSSESIIVLDWLHEVKQFVSFFNIHFYVSQHAKS